MKNQMMNLFASYSFYYFPGYYYGADCFCCNRKHRLHVFVTFPQAL